MVYTPILFHKIGSLVCLHLPLPWWLSYLMTAPPTVASLPATALHVCLCLVPFHQAFSDYQLQQMTSNFIDQFGFNEDEFAEQDERVE